MDEKITLAHGSGGKLTKDLIERHFSPIFDNPFLAPLSDSAILPFAGKRLAFTTDTFVVSPLFFTGGNIGKLSICGTVNDLSAGFSKPLYISCGFVIEEGFPVSDLEKIVQAMKETADQAGVKIVTGDTKVVEKGHGDGIFINTAGIGEVLLPDGFRPEVRPGDRVIMTGSMGDHGACIIALRSGIALETGLPSDCAPLNEFVTALFDAGIFPRFMRDPTRGGVSATLNDVTASKETGLTVFEEKVPVKEEVRGVCELLGIDPFFLANEGKMIVVVRENEAGRALEALRNCKYGRDAAIIGEVTDQFKGRVVVATPYGGRRVLDRPVSDPVPRIC